MELPQHKKKESEKIAKNKVPGIEAGFSIQMKNRARWTKKDYIYLSLAVFFADARPGAKNFLCIVTISVVLCMADLYLMF